MRAITLAGAFGLLVGCGDEEGSALCEDFAACGGEVEGSWTIAGLCAGDIPPPELPDACDEATIEPHIELGGTMEFTAGGDFTITTTITGFTDIEVPETCVPDLVNCDGLDDGAWDCSGTGTTGCSCRITVDEEGGSSGTWSVSGDTLALDHDDARHEERPFCRSGEGLFVETDYGVVELAVR